MQRVITMRKLGFMGQAGNQFMQVAFVRTYAKRFGLDYQLPPWGGQYLFGHADPPVTAKLPQWKEPQEPCKYGEPYGIPIPPVGDECVNHDFVGWAQYRTSWYAPDKDFIQGLFRVVSPERDRVEPALELLRAKGDTIISLHLRRGDSGRLIFPLTPIVWCLKWLHEHWGRFKNPALFIATEDISLVKYFHYYNPVVDQDLGIVPTGKPPPEYRYPHTRDKPSPQSLDWFPDWYILQHSDVLLASDSSYSVTAAMMNRSIQEFWRPRLSLQRFEQCDPWNMSFITKEHLDDHRGIPGTQLDSNPRFAHCWGNFKPTYPSVPETEAMIKEWEVPK